jgi:hypothetical protein
MFLKIVLLMLQRCWCSCLVLLWGADPAAAAKACRVEKLISVCPIVRRMVGIGSKGNGSLECINLQVGCWFAVL